MDYEFRLTYENPSMSRVEHDGTADYAEDTERHRRARPLCACFRTRYVKSLQMVKIGNEGYEQVRGLGTYVDIVSDRKRRARLGMRYQKDEQGDLVQLVKKRIKLPANLKTSVISIAADIINHL